VAVHAPQAAPGVRAKNCAISGATPQFGWPELGQGSTVDVPVAGRLVDNVLRMIEHEGDVFANTAKATGMIIDSWVLPVPEMLMVAS